MTSKELERDAKIEVAEVPSAAWGWSRINHRTWHATGVVIVIFLLAMLRGNHVGHIENLYLVGFAVIALFVIARYWWRRRRGNLY